MEKMKEKVKLKYRIKVNFEVGPHLHLQLDRPNMVEDVGAVDAVAGHQIRVSTAVVDH